MGHWMSMLFRCCRSMGFAHWFRNTPHCCPHLGDACWIYASVEPGREHLVVEVVGSAFQWRVRLRRCQGEPRTRPRSYGEVTVWGGAEVQEMSSKDIHQILGDRMIRRLALLSLRR